MTTYWVERVTMSPTKTKKKALMKKAISSWTSLRYRMSIFRLRTRPNFLGDHNPEGEGRHGSAPLTDEPLSEDVGGEEDGEGHYVVEGPAPELVQGLSPQQAHDEAQQR
jgi:hypothetical protein